MQEHDTREQAKMLAEFITPQALRSWIAQKIKTQIGDARYDFLDPSIGSGQLLFGLLDSISHISGFDVNQQAIQIAKNNFSSNGIDGDFSVQDYITSSHGDRHYDVAVSNYPFSLRPTDKQKEYILSHSFFGQFFSKKVTGVLDFIFILKSFFSSNQGFYLCFPGIGYRTQEEKYRRYLIDNNFLVEYGIIENCKFDHTSISILYVHLSKDQTARKIRRFRLDLQTGEELEEYTTIQELKKDYILNIPTQEAPNPYEHLDMVEVEAKARMAIIETFIGRVKLSRMVWSIDKKIREKLPSVDEWLAECVKEISLLIK